MRNNLDLAIALVRNRHHISKIAHAPIDFDFLVQEFFKGGDVEDFIGGGLRGIDYELFVRERKEGERLAFGYMDARSVRGRKKSGDVERYLKTGATKELYLLRNFPRLATLRAFDRSRFLYRMHKYSLAYCSGSNGPMLCSPVQLQLRLES